MDLMLTLLVKLAAIDELATLMDNLESAGYATRNTVRGLSSHFAVSLHRRNSDQALAILRYADVHSTIPLNTVCILDI